MSVSHKDYADLVSHWKAEIKIHQEAIRRIRLTRPEYGIGYDAIGRMQADFAISERQAIIRDRKAAIADAKGK
jgi:hypothetical protein